MTYYAVVFSTYIVLAYNSIVTLYPNEDFSSGNELDCNTNNNWDEGGFSYHRQFGICGNGLSDCCLLEAASVQGHGYIFSRPFDARGFSNITISFCGKIQSGGTGDPPDLQLRTSRNGQQLITSITEIRYRWSSLNGCVKPVLSNIFFRNVDDLVIAFYMGGDGVGDKAYIGNIVITGEGDTETPTNVPTSITINPSIYPTITPTWETVNPTQVPTDIPSHVPTMNTTNPTVLPTLLPTNMPTIIPSISPTITPTNIPSAIPSSSPSTFPSNTPTENPTDAPLMDPSNSYTNIPTKSMCFFSCFPIQNIQIAIYINI